MTDPSMLTLSFRQITPVVWMLHMPLVQAYLVRLDDGFALVDTLISGREDAILEALGEIGGAPEDLREIVLTHYHKDHMGSAAALVGASGAQLLAGRADVPVIEGTEPERPLALTEHERPLYDRIMPNVPSVPPPPVAVDRALDDGDELDWGERVEALHVPGHTPGSIALYLPASRFLFAGDVIATPPPGAPVVGTFNVDREQTIVSFGRLADLDLEAGCWGHGDPILEGASAALRAVRSDIGATTEVTLAKLESELVALETAD